MKNTIKIFLLLPFLVGCSTIIYSIRGPKYEGKFDVNSLPVGLDTTNYYYRKYSDDNKYGYLKFNNNGSFYGYTSEERHLTVTELNTIKPFENYYISKKGYLRWEVYHDSYNGYNLYKAQVYQDSIVAWQIGYKRTTQRTYHKMKS